MKSRWHYQPEPRCSRREDVIRWINRSPADRCIQTPCVIHQIAIYQKIALSTIQSTRSRQLQHIISCYFQWKEIFRYFLPIKIRELFYTQYWKGIPTSSWLIFYCTSVQQGKQSSEQSFPGPFHHQ